MNIIYDEDAPRTGGFVNYHNINACAGFLRHTYNLLTLQWIRDHTVDWREKRQCDREIAIAQRKVDYHRKHPNFEPTAIATRLAKMKKDFGQKESTR